MPSPEELGERHGFTGSVGVGLSSAGISCAPQCTADRLSAPLLTARIGGNVSPQFSLSLEASLFHADVKTVSPAGSWNLSWFTLSGIWYPNSETDFFLKFGVGVAAVKADVTFPHSGVLTLTSSDFGARVGIGKDYYLTDNLAVTAFADFLFTPRSQALSAGSDSGAKMSADVLHVGLALTIP